ncbi:MAG: hypothetical protein KDA28_09425, partial [Phycisphaerales bacterium]|nr:hypothetical protein [Phycisphaerales bacterium]
SYVLQAGFAEQESLGAAYLVDPGLYPIRMDLCEVIIAAGNGATSTVTEWTIQFWDGPPGSNLIVSYSSDNVLLPHIELPPGPSGVNLAFSIDPGDPDQVIFNNASGQSIISFSLRIDQHNNQTSNPCFTPPPSNSNAFPVTDVSGLAAPTRNWLRAIDCGPFGCNSGWNPFSSLGPCTPSGDWVMRMTWTSLDCSPAVGACCLPDGSCQIMTPADCINMNGLYQGDDSLCGDAICPQPDEACCFESTGGCLDLDPADCVSVGGIPGGPGTTCATHICFPMGACCLPDGTCVGPVSPEDCAAQGGTFQGDGSDCNDVDCPDPEGACCFGSGCLTLTAADCATAGGTWLGLGSDCADCDACAPDLTGDTTLDIFDILEFLERFSENDPIADWNDDTSIDIFDVIAFLEDFDAGC